MKKTSKDSLGLPPGEQERLKFFGLTGVLKEIDIKEINLTVSRDNGGRSVVIVPEKVEHIKAAIEAGDILPPIIVAKFGKSNQYEVWSGMHRTTAYVELKRKTITAVVVVCSDELLKDLTPASFNASGGDGLSRQERQNLARKAVMKYGWTLEKAAYISCLSIGQVKTAIRSFKERERIEELGVSTGKMGDKQIQYIAGLNNDNVIRDIANTVVAAKLTGDQTAELVREVKKERTESGQLRVAAEQRQERLGNPQQKTHLPKKVLDKRSLFRKALSQIITILAKVDNVAQLGFTDKSETDQVRKGLARLAAECGRVSTGAATSQKAIRKAS